MSLKSKQDMNENQVFVPYQETEGEEYMGSQQLDHFRKILLNWKQELLEEVDRTVKNLK